MKERSFHKKMELIRYKVCRLPCLGTTPVFEHSFIAEKEFYNKGKMS